MSASEDASALRHAVEALRGTPSGEARVLRLGAGRHFLSESLELGPDDSSLRIAGEDGAVVTGARTLPAPTVRPDGLWAMRAPVGVHFEQLYVNGSLAQRAHEPDEGFFLMTAPVPDRPKSAFYAKPGDLKPLLGLSADALRDVVLDVYQSWDVVRLHPKRVQSDGLVETAPKHWRYFEWMTYPPRYLIENFRAALDEAGEWYLDAAAGEVLYKPKPGETPKNTRIEYPVARRWLTIAGDGKGGRAVSDIAVENVSFDICAYVLKDGDGGQGNVGGADGAVTVSHARRITFDRCAFRRSGSYAVWFRENCRDCALTHSLIEYPGAGGALIGSTRYDPKRDAPENVTAFIRLDDNILRYGGRLLKSGCGVMLFNAADCTVSHNDIGDFYYTGVSMGWCWGYGDTPNRRNKIRFNRIHHIGWGLLSDMAGIYTLGQLYGCEIVGNDISQVYSGDYAGFGGFGIYPDEGSRGLFIASNLVHHAKSGGFLQHYGRDNRVCNNIFAYSEDGLLMRHREEPHLGFTAERNIFYADRAQPALRGFVSKSGICPNARFDRNLYWCGRPFARDAFFGTDWDSWRKGGQDGASQVADPLFVDAARGDFRLKPESPARAMGFVPWNLAEAGVRGTAESAWRRKAEQETYPPLKRLPYPPRFTLPCAADFETGTGAEALKPFSASAGTGSRGDGSVAVVTGDAARGRRFVEARAVPGLRPDWAPHVSCDLSGGTGRVVTTFAFQSEPQLLTLFQWRQWSNPYVDGVSLFAQGGKLLVDGRTLDLPSAGWCRLKVVIDFDKKPAEYAVTVTAPDGKTATLDGNKCPEAFRSLAWFGVITRSDVAGTWRFDDFAFRSEEAGK